MGQRKQAKGPGRPGGQERRSSAESTGHSSPRQCGVGAGGSQSTGSSRPKGLGVTLRALGSRGGGPAGRWHALIAGEEWTVGRQERTWGDRQEALVISLVSHTLGQSSGREKWADSRDVV